jgi:hypothetical protein
VYVFELLQPIENYVQQNILMLYLSTKMLLKTWLESLLNLIVTVTRGAPWKSTKHVQPNASTLHWMTFVHGGKSTLQWTFMDVTVSIFSRLIKSCCI